MFRIIALFLVALCLGLVVSAQNFDFTPNAGSTTQNGVCAGGACSIETIHNNPILQHQNYDYGQATGFTPPQNGATESKGGIGGTPFTYDFNCQFGNCIGEPSGSYKP